MSDLAAAVERSRGGFTHVQCPDHCQDCNDARLIAEAWLAENDPTPIDADWIHALGARAGLSACKDGSGGYSDSEAVLFLNDWESINKRDCERFWVVRIEKSQDGTWSVSVSVQENHRHNGTLHMAPAKHRGDVLRAFAALGITLKAEK